ncbi:flagellar basal-body MS-ring/collar protein FliF [Nitrosomonas supralitoralis]|uniref:Flagellar M-ring protein n=1 Tax=Nitrosomonas supralitoralis TaxID=2116706 RepID=A0A2P7NYX6_9PROT|nr:flagellar basal-body MS-ring/collar protein FliF [Nitrosomonas supralitoralis]PSJ18668.1 flagellar basal body M-ring protein FliF [Nitrosomonas supralitoralis]
MATIPSEANATNPATTGRLAHLSLLSNQKKLGLILSAAAVIALLTGALMWSQTPEYRALYNNLSDHDGAAIISALQQMNIPYKFSEGGSAILIPEKQVHEVRLKLAGQGLPKGGLVGFELMENQKFGSSQFLEQVNYQRALEGELARSVQALSAVQSARVHLAIAKPSVFAREKQQPSVSVLLNLYPGRVLGVEQVSAIVHLMASSVPNLPVKNVTVIDQNGNLLSTQNDKKEDSRFDAKQLAYLQELEENYIRRIETILTPITGAANVRAQVTADVDFSRIDRAEEIYRPNNTETDGASIRSQQTHESMSIGSKLDGGIPGALTNRPPEPAIAPIEAGGKKPAGDKAEDEDNGDKTPSLPTDKKKESTINYEVDKTVQHTQNSTGNIKRLSAAVVVNYRKKTDANGEVTYEPLSNEEIKEINNLVREAMGYNEKRGDSLTVTNNLFTGETQAVSEAPFWKDPDVIMLAKDLAKQLLILGVVLVFLLKILRPFLKSLAPPAPTPALTDKTSHADVNGTALEQLPEQTDGTAMPQTIQKSIFDENLKRAKQLALEEPVIVANVVKDWMVKNG